MRRTRAVLVGVLLLALSACTGDPTAEAPEAVPSPSPGTPTAALFERYVALGDSFTAGPLIPVTDVAGGCFRSDGNYPALLARRLDIGDFVDVSCSGARTRDLWRPQRTPLRGAPVPPQLGALDGSESLVTVGIGGNDFGLYGDLVATCLDVRSRDPLGSPCRDELARRGTDVDALTHDVGSNIERALRRVREDAPEARVVLVGYPRISPSSGSCPRRLPYAAGDLPFSDQVLRDLTTAMAAAARRAGAEFLDMYSASKGHDVCSSEPWVNGWRTDRARAAALHPLPAGMRAVARELVALLSRD